jgi:hypothetical protein
MFHLQNHCCIPAHFVNLVHPQVEVADQKGYEPLLKALRGADIPGLGLEHCGEDGGGQCHRLVRDLSNVVALQEAHPVVNDVEKRLEDGVVVHRRLCRYASLSEKHHT